MTLMPKSVKELDNSEEVRSSKLKFQISFFKFKISDQDHVFLFPSYSVTLPKLTSKFGPSVLP